MAAKTYDELALGALLKGDTKRLAALKKHSEGRFPCPDCGHEGPHHVQSYHGEPEFACAGCGMQHPVPGV